MRRFVKLPVVAGAVLVVAASLAAGGCGGSSTSSTAAACSAKPPAVPAAPADWTLPGGNLANTRDVTSPITSSNVSTLGVAWCVPVESTGVTKAAGLADGYATTPGGGDGGGYTQDQETQVVG